MTSSSHHLSVGTLKLIITASIFISALLSVIAPLFVINVSENVFSIGNMMASGVLLAAALTHQLADASQALDADDGYPWAMLIAGLTFIAFLILDESVHLLLGESSHDHDSDDGDGGDGEGKMFGGLSILAHAHTHGHNEHGHGHDHKHQHAHQHNHRANAPQSAPHREETPLLTNRKQQGRRLTSCSASMIQRGAAGAAAADTTPDATASSFRRSYRTYGKTAAQFSDNDELMEMKPFDTDEKGASGFTRGRGRAETRTSSLMGSILALDLDNHTTYSVHHHHDDHITQHLHGSTLASLMLFLALSLHSVLEGVAIGIVPNAEMVVSTSAAILAHKAFAGYALGSTMVTAEGVDAKRHLYLGLIFSSTTPLGVLLGLFLLNEFNDDGVAVGVAQAMVAGTFLYVAIVEVGMKELLVCRHGELEEDLFDNADGKKGMSIKTKEFLKLSFFLLGFLAMSGLAFFV